MAALRRVDSALHAVARLRLAVRYSLSFDIFGTTKQAACGSAARISARLTASIVMLAGPDVWVILMLASPRRRFSRRARSGCSVGGGAPVTVTVIGPSKRVKTGRLR